MPLKDLDHRPWPPPAAPWVMTQTWYNLLFAHWPIAAEALRALVPPQLELDTFDGQAWVGVVPFGMARVYPRGTFSVPWLSRFLEMNVRTYVTLGGKAGVYFFSLDAANSAAVALARRFFRLPYYHARMRMKHHAGWIEYRSYRIHPGATPAEFDGRYRAVGSVYASQPGSLDAWLTERYCLYTVSARGQVYRGEIHHPRWPLQAAEAEIKTNTMALASGLRLPNTPPVLHFARSLTTWEWLISRVRAGREPAPARTRPGRAQPSARP
jgi:uncharacterized protein YqjF (DUF2071 family)